MKGPRRLHPLWLGPWLLRAFLFLLLPLGQALFSGIPISRTLTAAAIAAGIFLFLLWFSSRAWQQGDRLAMEKGLFLRQKSFFSLARCPAVQMKTPVLFRLFRGCLVGLPGRGHRFFSTVAPAYGPEAPPFLPRQTAVFLVPTGGALLRLFPIRSFGRHFSARHVAAPVGKLARHAGAFFVDPGNADFPFSFVSNG